MALEGEPQPLEVAPSDVGGTAEKERKEESGVETSERRRELPKPASASDSGEPPKRKPSVVSQRPYTRTPTQRTFRLCLRGNYGPKELKFVVGHLQKPPHCLRLTKSDNDWDTMWTMRVTPEEFGRLAPWQKVNFLPGFRYVCRKDLLHREFSYLRRKCFGRLAWHSDALAGRKEALRARLMHIPLHEITSEHLHDLRILATCSFWPEGYSLEEEDQLALFKSILRREVSVDSEPQEEEPLYIVKKPFSSNGRAVYLVKTEEELDELLREGGPCHPLTRHRPLAQRYLADVQLFDGFKFTMRVYVAVTSVNPLRCYVYRDGLLRICSKRYSTDYKDAYKHIDSYELNTKNDEEAERISDELPHDGLRCSIKLYFELLRKRGIDTEKIWRDIDDVAAMALISSEIPITKAVQSQVQQRSHAFELLGYDILLDGEFKPWLLEVNHTPAIGPHTELENSVKDAMLGDLLLLVDACSRRKRRVLAESNEASEHLAAIQATLAAGERPSVPNEKLLTEFDVEHMSRADTWVLVDQELEERDRHGWARVLPNFRHLPFMEQNRNVLSARWIREDMACSDLRLLDEDGRPHAAPADVVAQYRAREEESEAEAEPESASAAAETEE
mmetsp:Transcript_11197/g.45559  ORF Transcript_11197/g.45559 Transcript_11197/m.45559 type:complete len:618 (+) Transcript_11197:90-1943(+)